MNHEYYTPIEQPLLEGETTVLRNSQKYLDIAGNREPNVDWAVIPEMIKIVEGSGLQEPWRQEALGHLRDAANENLSEQRRMQHFDHAGSRVWEGGTIFYRNGTMAGLAKYMTLFARSGGK